MPRGENSPSAGRGEYTVVTLDDTGSGGVCAEEEAGGSSLVIVITGGGDGSAVGGVRGENSPSAGRGDSTGASAADKQT